MRALAVLVVLLPVAAAAETITVTADDCRRVVRHVPDASVAYTPGRDVDGNAVAPADLGGSVAIRPPETILIPITIKLGPRFGVPANPTAYKAEAHVGLVQYRDGRFWYNGQPLDDEADRTIRARCRAVQR
ncbi:MAG: hypothetical protein FJX67_09245 [Alphaproteobacteria bacterium]|nr:hypothetical protein [Alphaproteobacteria bacterium]